MPLTPKERQKLYRERLKEVNPEKFKLKKKEKKEKKKKKKKKSKKEPKPEVVPLEGHGQILTQKRNYNRSVIYRLKNENTKLEEELKKI
ncbi:unnamed protein product [Parnassius apollo]|uniref:(apollo) hypothetical protein n=1 Tax=Parnassius apollo TaxID=110799 RepID=A0A8S3WW36_PARAO|nr:unnamed protein product [Parnassius apollo]